VRIDSLALQMRPRAPHEAADLGIRLCQANARAVYRCYLVVAIPMALLALSLFEIRPWLPVLVMWWSKPWLDRTILFVLSRAAFGQQTTIGDLWREQRATWWRGFILTWTWRRLSPWRSFTQAVYQLEGHSFFRLRQRIVQIRRKYSGAASIMTAAFHLSEQALAIGLFSLVFWLDPGSDSFEFSSLFNEETSTFIQVASSIAYMGAVLFLEPFYVGAGFGMYLNRRAELEAWDIEQEFRRAFAS
jgi:hypothetical protein